MKKPKTLAAMLTAVALATLPFAACAADKEQGITDSAKAGPDFAVQGEYIGKVNGQAQGAQVIALGDGKFDLVLFAGGLPGEGWKRGDAQQKGTGATSGSSTLFEINGGNKAEFEGSVLLVRDSSGKNIGQLKKVHRKSETLGAKPPKGAVVLFDGSSTDHWENGHLSDDGYLMAGTSCKELIDGGTIHVEFRTPFKPHARGQGRGNSGVYIYGIYECQVLDSFGLDGADNECGGIYKASKPAVNMCFPPLAWQTYDIEFTAPGEKNGKATPAVVSIKHNGVVIHENLKLPQPTPGGKNRGYLYLQGHGNPVAFRNIWAVPAK